MLSVLLGCLCFLEGTLPVNAAMGYDVDEHRLSVDDAAPVRKLGERHRHSGSGWLRRESHGANNVALVGVDDISAFRSETVSKRDLSLQPPANGNASSPAIFSCASVTCSGGCYLDGMCQTSLPRGVELSSQLCRQLTGSWCPFVRIDPCGACSSGCLKGSGDCQEFDDSGIPATEEFCSNAGARWCAPASSLGGSIAPGSTSLKIQDSSSFFVGGQITLGSPNDGTEETRIITSMINDTATLNRPLASGYPGGTKVKTEQKLYPNQKHYPLVDSLGDGTTGKWSPVMETDGARSCVHLNAAGNTSMPFDNGGNGKSAFQQRQSSDKSYFELPAVGRNLSAWSIMFDVKWNGNVVRGGGVVFGLVDGNGSGLELITSRTVASSDLRLLDSVMPGLTITGPSETAVGYDWHHFALVATNPCADNQDFLVYWDGVPYTVSGQPSICGRAPMFNWGSCRNSTCVGSDMHVASVWTAEAAFSQETVKAKRPLRLSGAAPVAWQTSFPAYNLSTGYQSPLSREGRVIEEKAVAAISANRVFQYISTMTSFRSRRWNSDDADSAAASLMSEFKRLGLTTCAHKFNLGGRELTNVVAYQRGGSPETVVVGAHYDTQAKTWRKSPGAVDNGSGIGGLLAIARAFKMVQVKTRKSVYFVAFAGQKAGQRGSRTFVEALSATDSTLPAECRWGAASRPRSRPQVIIMDQIAWVSPNLKRSNGAPQYTVTLESLESGDEMMEHMAQASKQYNGEALAIVRNNYPFGSDHVSFLNASCPAVLTTNGDDESYAELDGPNDNLDQVDGAMGSLIAKMNMAATLRLSGVIKPYRLAACGGSISGKPTGYDCTRTGEIEDIMMGGWEKDGKTFEECKAFCDVVSRCIGCVHHLPDMWTGEYFYPIAVWRFQPCNAGDNCYERLGFYEKDAAGEVDEPMSTLLYNNFQDRGVSDLPTYDNQTYLLMNGYPCTLKGWTKTSGDGFTRNTAGEGKAIVFGLIPGDAYNFRVYQTVGSGSVNGSNLLYVNGILEGVTMASLSLDPTAQGTAIANSAGQIVFRFIKKATQVLLSALAVGRKASGSITEGTTCPWLKGNTLLDNQLQCLDGTECSTGRGCCEASGGIAKCPPNAPVMCKDLTCDASCATRGGPRGCDAVPTMSLYGRSCPWLDGPTSNEEIQCFDGSRCSGDSDCCRFKGGRARCPASRPEMCNAKSCGGDYCCDVSCESYDGPRKCTASGGVSHQAPKYVTIRDSGKCCTDGSDTFIAKITTKNQTIAFNHCSGNQDCQYVSVLPIQETVVFDPEAVFSADYYLPKPYVAPDLECTLCKACRAAGSTGIGVNVTSAQKYLAESPKTTSLFFNAYDGLECCSRELVGSTAPGTAVTPDQCEESCAALPDCLFFTHESLDFRCKFCKACDVTNSTPRMHKGKPVYSSWQHLKASTTPAYVEYPGRLCAKWKLKETKNTMSRAWCESACTLDNRCMGYSWNDAMASCILEGAKDLLVPTDGFQQSVEWSCHVRRQPTPKSSKLVMPLIGFDATRLNVADPSDGFMSVGRVARVLAFDTNVASFDGGASFLLKGDRMYLGELPSPTFTVEAYVKLAGAEGDGMFGQVIASCAERGWSLTASREGVFQASVPGGRCDCPAPTPSTKVPVYLDVWAHVALTRGEKEYALYVDGSQCCTVPNPTKLRNTTVAAAYVYMGGKLSAHVHFVKVYGTQVGGTYVQELANEAHEQYKSVAKWEQAPSSPDCADNKIQSLSECRLACATLGLNTSVVQMNSDMTATHCSRDMESSTCYWNVAKVGFFGQEGNYSLCRLPASKFEYSLGGADCEENKINTFAECETACRAVGGTSREVVEKEDGALPTHCSRGIGAADPCYWNTMQTGKFRQAAYRTVCRKAAAPFALTEPGGACPREYITIQDQETCQDAYSSLKPSSPNPHNDSNSIYLDALANADQLPRGCFMLTEGDMVEETIFNLLGFENTTHITARMYCRKAKAPYWRLLDNVVDDSACDGGRWLVNELEFYENDFKHEMADSMGAMADTWWPARNKALAHPRTAFDGKADSGSGVWSSRPWRNNRTTLDSFIGYKFEVPVSIDRVKIKQYPGCSATSVKVQFSWNNRNWHTLWVQNFSAIHEHQKDGVWQDALLGTSSFTEHPGHCITAEATWPNSLKSKDESLSLMGCKRTCSAGKKCAGLTYNHNSRSCELYGQDYTVSDETRVFTFIAGNGGIGSVFGTRIVEQNSTCYAKEAPSQSVGGDWSCYEGKRVVDATVVGPEHECSNFNFSSMAECQAKCEVSANCFAANFVSGLDRITNCSSNVGGGLCYLSLTGAVEDAAAKPGESHQVCVKPKLAEFLRGVPSSNKCPVGYRHVRGDEQCFAASETFNATWAGPVDVLERPKGCFEHASGAFNVNKNPDVEYTAWQGPQGIPICKLESCKKSHSLSSFLKIDTMKADGWTFNFTDDHYDFRPLQRRCEFLDMVHDDLTEDRSPQTYWGFQPGSDAGEISLELTGSGRIRLDFGSGCHATYRNRSTCTPTTVLLNGLQMSSAAFNTTSKIVFLAFTDGDVLKLREANGVILINSLQITCAPERLPCHGTCKRWPKEEVCQDGQFLTAIRYAMKAQLVFITGGTCSDGTVLEGGFASFLDEGEGGMDDAQEHHDHKGTLAQPMGASTIALSDPLVRLKSLRFGTATVGRSAGDVKFLHCPDGWKLSGWKQHVHRGAVVGLEPFCALAQQAEDTAMTDLQADLLSCCDEVFQGPDNFWRKYLSMSPVPSYCTRSQYEAKCTSNSTQEDQGVCEVCRRCFDKGCPSWLPDQQSLREAYKVKKDASESFRTCGTKPEFPQNEKFCTGETPTDLGTLSSAACAHECEKSADKDDAKGCCQLLPVPGSGSSGACGWISGGFANNSVAVGDTSVLLQDPVDSASFDTPTSTDVAKAGSKAKSGSKAKAGSKPKAGSGDITGESNSSEAGSGSVSKNETDQNETTATEVPDDRWPLAIEIATCIPLTEEANCSCIPCGSSSPAKRSDQAWCGPEHNMCSAASGIAFGCYTLARMGCDCRTEKEIRTPQYIRPMN